MSQQDELIVRKDGSVGHLRLNRPNALNALTHKMCLKIEEALIAWRNDDSIKAVIVDAEGDRAFCAGGDIQHLYETAQSDPEPGRQFWRDEYRLNAMINTYPKPYIPIMNGITMGGGVGISAHGSHRIVSDNSMIAMPETSIGFIPDVGGTWLLSRSPGHTGEYLGLTGARMNADDAIFAGFADHYIPSDSLNDFKSALAAGISADDAVSTHGRTPPEGALAAIQQQIDQAFAHKNMAGIVEHLARLAGSGDDWSTKTLTMISRNSPFAVCATLEAIRKARQLQSLTESLDLEFNYAYRAIAEREFIEGIRAMVIDKDRQPQWQPETIEQVTSTMIEDMFAPLGEQQLEIA